MVSPDNTRNVASRIYYSTEDLKKEKVKFDNEILNNIDSWWKGIPAKAFKEGYSNRVIDMTKVFTSLANIQNALHKIANSIQKIDDERIAEAIRKAANTKKSK
jgi:uncharacterized protein YukE